MTTAPTHTATSTSGVRLCWKMNARGGWEKVPAPWGNEKPEAWFHRHANGIVFTSRLSHDLDDIKPAVEVFQLLGFDPSDASATLIGCFEGMVCDGERELGRTEFYFLIDSPALPKLIADYSSLLNHHPVVTREDHKRRMRAERDARLLSVTLPRDPR